MRAYNSLANVPWKEMARIRDQIQNMDVYKNDKKILEWYFIDGYPTRMIPQLCSENNIRSRNNTFYTQRSIQNIIKKYFPEIAVYRKPNKYNEIRKEHFRFIKENRKERCAKCGSHKDLEWHHMIPLKDGGKTIEANMICLCRECHKNVERYNTEWRRSR